MCAPYGMQLRSSPDAVKAISKSGGNARSTLRATQPSMKTLLTHQPSRFVLLTLLAGSLCIVASAQNLSSPGNNFGSSRAQASYEQLPLTFEANWGQTDARVKFLARGSGYTVFLTAGKMVLR